MFEELGTNLIEGLSVGIDENISSAAQEMVKLSSEVRKPMENLSLPTYETKMEYTNPASGLVAALKALGLSKMPNLKISRRALGGIVEPGEFFLARESGPELVGTIGGHTAVMNNNQIVDSVSGGVYKAVVSALDAKFAAGGSNQPIHITVELDGDVIGKKVVNYNKEMVKRTGGSPFVI